MLLSTFVKKDKVMVIEDEVKEEWKRFLESDEFRHNPECGTLLIAQHFADWGSERFQKLINS